MKREKRVLKVSICFLLTIMMVCMVIPVTYAAELDGTQSDWAVEELNKAEEYGLTDPTTMNSFDKAMTREEFCTIAVKLYEKLSGKVVEAANNPFLDTDNPEVLKAFQLEIIFGTAENMFSPHNSVTREEICTMIFRALKAAIPNLNVSASTDEKIIFADADKIDSWAMNSVRYAYKNGIMKGTAENIISPLENVTREQAIALVKRTYERFTRDLSNRSIPVARLADQAISQMDYLYILNSIKADMLSQFGMQAGTENEEMLWSQPYDETHSLMDYIKNEALMELVDMKICVSIANEQGISLSVEELNELDNNIQMQVASIGGEEAFLQFLSQNGGLTREEYRKLYSESMLRNKLIEATFEEIDVPESEAVAFYEKNADAYGTATVRHILFLYEGDDPENPRTKEESNALADEMLKRVNSGEDMTKLANEFSEDGAVVQNSGEYTFGRNDSFVQEFLDWGFSAKVGDTGIVETSYGYHIMKKEGEAVQSFEELSEQMITEIRNQKLTEIYLGWQSNPKYELIVNEIQSIL